MEKRRVAQAELHAPANGAASDAPEDIAPALVGRDDAVRDHEGGGAGVVGEHAQSGHALFVGLGHVDRGQVCAHGHQAADEVGVVVRCDALQDARDALEAHAGVDRRVLERHPRAVCELLVLHKDEVPELHVAVGATCRALRAVAHGGAEVVVNLGARTARPGVAHRPEVVFVAQALHPGFGHAVLAGPEVPGFVVGVVDGHPHPVEVELPHVADQLPGEADGLFLEVVAKAEVAEHLEERVVAGRAADFFEVVVLARDPQTLLGRGGAVVVAFLLAREDVLELHHTRVDKHEGGVVGDQAAAGLHAVAAASEEVEEFPTNLGAGAGGRRHENLSGPGQGVNQRAPVGATSHGLGMGGGSNRSLARRTSCPTPSIPSSRSTGCGSERHPLARGREGTGDELEHRRTVGGSHAANFP